MLRDAQAAMFGGGSKPHDDFQIFGQCLTEIESRQTAWEGKCLFFICAPLSFSILILLLATSSPMGLTDAGRVGADEEEDRGGEGSVGAGEGRRKSMSKVRDFAGVVAPRSKCQW